MRWPARSISAAQITPAIRTAASTASHVGCARSTLPVSRVTSAGSDWLPSQPTNPVRWPWANSPVSQYLLESAGSTANPIRNVAANVPVATAACRNLRVSTRYGMKISGIRSIPAPMPMPAPFHQRRSGWTWSQMIRVISTISIWPRNSVRCIGSVHSSGAAISSVPPSRARSRRQPRPPSVIQIVASMAAMFTPTVIFASVMNENSVSTVNTIAANGL